MKQLLIVHPAFGSFDRATARKLERAGFIVVRGDPEHFKAVDVLTLRSSSALMRAALKTVNEPCARSYATEIRSQFAKFLTDDLLAEPPQEQTK